MSLRQYDPFWIMHQGPSMDSVFEDIYGNNRVAKRDQGNMPMATMGWAPVVDMRETDNAFLIHAELPGIKKEDLSLALHGDVLTLSGERCEKKKEDNERVHRVERSYGKFSRTFTLPKNADHNNIQATHDNGVLELTIPKVAPVKPEARKIDIKGATQSK